MIKFKLIELGRVFLVKIKLAVICIAIFINFNGNAQQQLDSLGRGVLAVKAGSKGNLVSWRLLVSDKENVKFNVYRNTNGNSVKLNDIPISTKTNYFDTSADNSKSNTYHVTALINGIEGEPSKPATLWEQNYLTIPLNRPAGGTNESGSYTYSPNDASIADLDGDGEYEIVLKWDPSNSKDNSQSGYTGNVLLDGYELDGTHLWRIDLGINIRAGAHYTQFMVYDLDGDGKAEIACKTADGTTDGLSTIIGDTSADYRNTSGYILSGPEYFTIFEGATGKILATTNYKPARGNVSSWGDSYGNRVDRFLACVAHLDGSRPSVVMCRGYYTRTVLVAWDWRDGQLTERWTFDSNNGYSSFTGQGNHNISVGDIDQDGKDEIVYGNCAIDHDGKGMWSNGLGHGDAMHLSDIDPDRPGLEKWGITEPSNTSGSQLLDAMTGISIWETGPGDIGRGVSANLSDTHFGMECWGGTDGLRSCKNVKVGNSPSSSNHVIWWNGDLQRELLNGNNIRTYSGTTLLLADGCSSINGTKANPCLQVDILGDWREEVLFRTDDNSALRLYATMDTTSYRIITLMHDLMYREGIAWQNVGYNQPPHTSFFIGDGMFLADSLRPPSTPLNIVATALNDTVILTWNKNADGDLAGYNVYRSRNEDGPFERLNVNILDTTYYLDVNVTNDTVYFYAIRAIDLDSNESGNSRIIKAIPTIRPDFPGGLTARNDLKEILIFWYPVNETNLKGYNIYRTIYSGRNYELIAFVDNTVTSFIDSNLTTNKTYYYLVRSIDNTNKESFDSEEVNATTGPYIVLQAEDGIVGGTVFLENNHLGYNGTGFTNFDSNNSSIEFQHLGGFGGGHFTLLFRYALGSASRTGALVVNGKSQSLTMNGTTEWTNWSLDSTAITLQAGFNNIIKFQSSGSDFGNLDEFVIYNKIGDIIPDTTDTSNNVGVEQYNDLNKNIIISAVYPNPFTSQTQINIDVKENSRINIEVYNSLGVKVKSLANKEFPTGNYNINWNGKQENGHELPAGLYLYKITTNNNCSKVIRILKIE